MYKFFNFSNFIKKKSMITIRKKINKGLILNNKSNLINQIKKYLVFVHFVFLPTPAPFTLSNF